MPAPAKLTTEAYLKGARSAFEIGEVGKGKELLQALAKRFPSENTQDQIKDIRKKYGVQ
jgi:hypothetical protein